MWYNQYKYIPEGAVPMKPITRLCSVLTAVAMSLSLLSPLAPVSLPELTFLTAHAEEAIPAEPELNYEGQFTYIINDDHIEVTGFRAEKVVIPDTIDGLPVTELSIWPIDTMLKELTLPKEMYYDRYWGSSLYYCQALQQIEDKSYALPFAADDRKLYKIGVSFDSETRMLSDWKVVEG